MSYEIDFFVEYEVNARGFYSVKSSSRDVEILTSMNHQSEILRSLCLF